MSAPRPILLVEDNATTRKLVRFTLEAAGFQLLDAPDGASALRLFAEGPVALVLQDLRLPDMEGFDLVRRLRELPGGVEVPILAFSGLMSELDEARVWGAGFDDLIPKPIEPSRLLALVRARLSAGAPPVTAPFGAGRRLILADDDAVQRKLAAFRFQQQGFEVVAAGDGKEALEHARAAPPDAIVSDVLMPRMDGFGLSMAVRGDPRLAHLPVILATNSYVEPQDREFARRAGADELVLRTPDLGDVFTALGAALSRSRPAPRPAPVEAALEREHHERILRQLERQVALSTGATRRSAQLAAEIALLNGVSEALAANESIEVALEHTLAACFDAAAISTGALCVFTPDGSRVVPFGDAAAWQSEVATAFADPEARAALHDAPAIQLPDPAAPAALSGILERTGARAGLVVPLRYRSELLGALLMLGDGNELTGADRVAFAQAVTSQIGQALALSRAFAELESSERAAREQASLLDHARDAIIVRGLDDSVSFWNRGAERLYGWSSEEALGRSIVELTYLDPRLFDRAGERLFENGGWTGEMEQVRKDGSTIVVEGRWTVVRDPAGAPRSVMCIHTDVTEQRKLQAQFLRNQRLESIGTLAGGIAHDLNNVLAPIMMSIGMLKEMATDEQSLDILGTLQESTTRGASLVKQVLAFARGAEGARAPVDLGRLVADVEGIVRDTFPKSVTFDTVVADPIDPIEADSTQIHQVVLNLCVNARDAMPRGGALRIAVANVDVDASYAAMSPHAVPGRYVLLEVADSGEGIPPEVVDRIFDPFFSTKPVGQGTGLGLSTVDGIVRAHQGFLSVQSEPGRGTTFRVYLPAGTRDAPVEAAPAPAPRGDGQLVLVVDDEVAVRTVASQTLETFGYRVLAAVDGADALAVFARRGPEIAAVVTDTRMPIMDGLAMTRALQRLDPAVRVIVASGQDSVGNEERFAALGLRHFLPKPYTADQLLESLHEILAEPR